MVISGPHAVTSMRWTKLLWLIIVKKKYSYQDTMRNTENLIGKFCSNMVSCLAFERMEIFEKVWVRKKKIIFFPWQKKLSSTKNFGQSIYSKPVNLAWKSSIIIASLFQSLATKNTVTWEKNLKTQEKWILCSKISIWGRFQCAREVIQMF